MAWKKELIQNSSFHLFLILLALAPYFINLGESALWDANESFYAETPREMLESSNFVIPMFNYTFRWQKPPLTYWGVAAAYKLFGISEWSERLPIVLATYSWVLLAYAVGKYFFNPQLGLYAALFLALNFRIFVMSRRAITEIWLSLFLSLALLLLYRAYRENKSSSRVWMAGAWAALGLAVLTKGPVALIILFGVFFLLFFWERFFSWHFFLWLLVTCLVFWIVILPWYACVVSWMGWQPVQSFLFSDNLGRYLTEDFGPRRGIFYYVSVVLGDFFPWIFLGMATFSLQILRMPNEFQGKSFVRFLTIWFLFGIGFFSFSRNKQEYYVMPFYFPASLLIAQCWFSSQKDSLYARSFLRFIFGFLGVLLFSSVFLIYGLSTEFIENLGLSPHLLASWALFAISSSLFLFWKVIQRQWNSCLHTALAVAWVLLLTISVWILPTWERNKPVRDFAGDLLKITEATDWVGYYKVAVPSLAFYMHRPIHEIIDEKQFIQVILRCPGRKYFILRQDDYEQLRMILEEKQYRVLRKEELWRWRFQDLLQITKKQESSSLLLIAGS